MKTAASRRQGVPARSPAASLSVMAVLTLTAATPGCGDAEKPPKLSSVTPAHAYSDVAIPLTLSTDDLRPALEVLVSDQRAEYDESTIHASLVPAPADGRPTVSLDPVVWHDMDFWHRSHFYRATVPADVSPGLYDVRIEGPDGQVASLPAAFEELGPDLAPPGVMVTSPGMDELLAAGAPGQATVTADDGFGELDQVTVETEAGSRLTCAVGLDPATGLRWGRTICTGKLATPSLPDAALMGTFWLRASARDLAGQITSQTLSLSIAHVPRIDSFTDTVGALQGGQPFTVRGHFFLPGARVLLDGVPLENAVRVDDTLITGLTPARARAGAVDVQVEVDGPGAGRADTQFRYVAPPHIRTVFPATAPASGGTRVTIAGNDLRVGVIIKFGATLEAAVPLQVPLYAADNKVVGCLPPGHGTVLVWASDTLTGDSPPENTFPFTYTDDPADGSSNTVPCDPTAGLTANAAPATAR